MADESGGSLALGTGFDILEFEDPFTLLDLNVTDSLLNGSLLTTSFLLDTPRAGETLAFTLLEDLATPDGLADIVRFGDTDYSRTEVFGLAPEYVAPVPLPASGWLLVSVLGGVSLLRRRKHAQGPAQA